MAVTISLVRDINFNGAVKGIYPSNGGYLIYDQCKGLIEKVTAADDLGFSKKLEREMIEAQINVPITERELNVTLASLLVNKTKSTLMIVHGGLLQKLIAKYPGAELSFYTIYNREGVGRFPLTKKLLKSSVCYQISQGDLTRIGIPPGTTAFVAENLDTYIVTTVNDGPPPRSMSNFVVTIRLPGNGANTTTVAAAGTGPGFSTLLWKGDHTDFTIVAKDGSELHCHKYFLTFHSDVFGAMLCKKGQSKESQTGILEMSDMTGAGVRAFLEFLYSFKIKSAEENGKVALELLRAGHKYNIKTLEDAMKNLFLSWPTIWPVTDVVEVGLGLFRFVRNIDEMGALKSKSIEILKGNSEELLTAECYQKLFVEDVPVAMELCAAFASA